MNAMQGARLVDIYRNTIRPYLASEGTTDLAGADQAIDVLEAALKYPSRLSVGFVGEAQVGKSSLINALVRRTTLPSGGVGPLTASDTHVTYAEDPIFTARYHTKMELHQLAFALETHLLRRGKSIKPAELTAPVDEASAEAVPPDPVEIVGDDAAATAARTEASRKVSSMIAQAKQILVGEMDPLSGAPDLSDDLALEGLRAVLGYKVRCDPELLSKLQARIAAVRERLGTTEKITTSALASPTDFDRELWLRAAGWLSPLVASLEVGLNAEILRHLDFVDLPGIGVIGDPATAHALRFVTTEGGDLVLVTRNSGVTGELASLLEQAGVIRRLLFGGRDGRPGIHILIVVTHLDDVARERRRAMKHAAAQFGGVVETPDAIFARLSAEMRVKVREHMRFALMGSPSFQDIPEAHRERREAVVKQLCDDLAVECVAAPDFASLTYQPDDSFLLTPEGTGVPAVERHLTQLAAGVVERRSRAIEQAAAVVEEVLQGHFNALRVVYGEGGGQAQAAWDSFRSHLEQKLHELRPQMAAFQGELMGVLNREIPTRIELMCANANNVALKRLGRLKAHGRTLAYQSLNAALKRDGIWGKQQINYPESLTSVFVDTIATEWEPKVIEVLRATMRDASKRSLGLVEQLCEEARRYDDRIVSEAQIDAQKKLLLQQSHTAVAWTKEKLDALRAEVQQKLYDAVSQPIAQACAEAVRQKRNVDSGARERILEAFDAGGQTAIEKATHKAQQVLLGHHKKLVKELSEGLLKEHHDPLSAAFHAMTSETLARARRSDAQKRRKVLERLDALNAELTALVAQQWQETAS